MIITSHNRSHMATLRCTIIALVLCIITMWILSNLTSDFYYNIFYQLIQVNIDNSYDQYQNFVSQTLLVTFTVSMVGRHIILLWQGGILLLKVSTTWINVITYILHFYCCYRFVSGATLFKYFTLQRTSRDFQTDEA